MDYKKDNGASFLDEEWDVEKALQQKNAQLNAPQSAPTRQEAPSKTKSASRRKAAPAAKTQRPIHRRELLILLGAVAAIVLIIVLVVALSSGNDSDEAPQTEVYGPTYPLEYIAEALVEEADLLAAGYDYDAAIDLLHTFGEGFEDQSALVEAQARYQEAKSAAVRWEDTTTIPHVFFHTLIVDTKRAFDGDSQQTGYNQDMVTVAEFEAILEALYAKGYVLVSIHDIAVLGTNNDGNAAYVQGDIYLPPDKKPLVMSQDDVNYYGYMVDGDNDGKPDALGDGFACQLLLDENGGITCKYIDAAGETLYGNYDLVPILEAFIQEHPDFSYRGARAALSLTGYEGVFGYATHPDEKDILGEDLYNEEVRKATEVAQWLRAHGWDIASHSYNHAAYGYNETNGVMADLERWETEVQSIVGDTDILIYPFGIDIAGEEDYSGAKFEAMYAVGYRYFCGMGSDEYWVQIRDTYVRQARRNIDGYHMYWWPELLDDLFDAETILDPERPDVPTKN